MEVCVFPFIYVWKRESKSFTLSILYCIVQWQNVHLALLLLSSANVQQPQRKRQMALNQMEKLHLKWQVPPMKRIQLYWLFLRVIGQLIGEEKEKIEIRVHFTGFNLVFILRLIVLALQCCLKHSVCLFYRHRNTKNKLSCGNCQTYILRDFSLKKKKTKKTEREQKHFIVLYIWKYMSEYWKKKLYVN